ncbi:hypothetical protein GCM10022270_16060 [Terriglobus aquaticus]
MTFTLTSAAPISDASADNAEVSFELRLHRFRLIRCFENLEQASEVLSDLGLVSDAVRPRLFRRFDSPKRIELPPDYDVSFLPWLGFDIEDVE